MDLDSISEISATMLLVGGVHFCLSRVEGRPPLENLFIGGVSGSLVKTSEYGPFPLCRSRRFRINGQPDAADGHVQFHTRFKTGYDF